MVYKYQIQNLLSTFGWSDAKLSGPGISTNLNVSILFLSSPYLIEFFIFLLFFENTTLKIL